MMGGGRKGSRWSRRWGGSGGDGMEGTGDGGEAAVGEGAGARGAQAQARPDPQH